MLAGPIPVLDMLARFVSDKHHMNRRYHYFSHVLDRFGESCPC